MYVMNIKNMVFRYVARECFSRVGAEFWLALVCGGQASTLTIAVFRTGDHENESKFAVIHVCYLA